MTRLLRRLMAGLILILSLAALPAGPLAAMAGQGSATESALAIIAQVERQTEAVRGLHARRPVAVSLLSPVAFQREVQRVSNRDTTPASIRDQDQPLVLLGLLSPRADLRAILSAQLSANVAAFYDPVRKRFFIPLRPSGLSLYDRVVISHEYTHALQDQTFDLLRLRPDPAQQAIHNSDRYLALTALIEGDATAEMSLYAQIYFTPAQLTEFYREALAAANGVQDTTPRFLQDELYFPYQQGLTFEMKLLHVSLRGTNFTAVNNAFRHPPVSTRQILHPELYLRSPLAVTPDLATPQPALPPDWSRVDSDVVGEYQLQDMLAQRLGGATAAHAADGWRADRYALFDRGRDYLMAWRLRAATAASARSLGTALTTYLARRYHTTLALRGSTVRYASTDGAMALRVSGADIAVVLGSRAALMPTVSQALAAM